MEDYKAVFHYKNGSMIKEDLPSLKGKPIEEFVAISSTIKGVQLMLAPAANQTMIDGSIEVLVNSKELSLKFSVVPVHAEQTLRDSVTQTYTISER